MCIQFKIMLYIHRWQVLDVIQILMPIIYLRRFKFKRQDRVYTLFNSNCWEQNYFWNAHAQCSYRLMDAQLKAFFSVCCMMFLKLSNKSHTMKALIILSHSWLPFFLLVYLYGEMNFIGTLCTILVYFRETKTPPVLRELICNDRLLQNYPCPI